MKLEQFIAGDSRLSGLLQLSRYWQRLDTEAKRLLPPNLHRHFRVVCMEESTLVLHADTPMAATRLKMLLPALLPQLQAIEPRIAEAKIKVSPASPETPKNKNFHISAHALDCFSKTAEKVAHCPELAQSIRKLVENNRQINKK